MHLTVYLTVYQIFTCMLPNFYGSNNVTGQRESLLGPVKWIYDSKSVQLRDGSRIRLNIPPHISELVMIVLIHNWRIRLIFFLFNIKLFEVNSE